MLFFFFPLSRPGFKMSWVLVLKGIAALKIVLGFVFFFWKATYLILRSEVPYRFLLSETVSNRSDIQVEELTHSLNPGPLAALSELHVWDPYLLLLHCCMFFYVGNTNEGHDISSYEISSHIHSLLLIAETSLCN